MESTGSDINLIDCLEVYLTAHGEGSMIEIARPFPHLAQWTVEHDSLGWDNFLEGRIGNRLFGLQQMALKRHGSRLHISSWASRFIHLVLDITHKQWLFQNAICLLEGKTATEHQAIMEQVGMMICTDPALLSPQHRHLFETDFEQLGEGPSTARQYWLASLE
jgi:hypothetical protein